MNDIIIYGGQGTSNNSSNAINVASDEPIYTAKEIAKELGVDETTVLRDIAKFKIPVAGRKINRNSHKKSNAYSLSYLNNCKQQQQMQLLEEQNLKVQQIVSTLNQTPAQVGGLIQGTVNALNDDQLNCLVVEVINKLRRERDCLRSKNNELLQTTNDQNAVIQTKQSYIEENKERVIIGKCLEECKNNLSIGDFCKVLQKNGLEYGRNKFFNKLREQGFICKNSTAPTQSSLNKGYFTAHEYFYVDGCGNQKSGITSRITPIGQRKFLLNLQQVLGF